MRFIPMLRIFCFITISLLPLCRFYSQDIESTLEYARRLWINGQKQESIPLLLRIAFFDSSGTYRYHSFRLLAEAYEANDPRTSMYYYDLAAGVASDDSLKADAVFRKINLIMRQGLYDRSAVELMKLENQANPALSGRYSFYMGVLNYRQGKYSDAEKYLRQCIDSAGFSDLSLHIRKAEKIQKRYKPKTARIMSIILPGTGQLASGNYGEALNSFLLVGALGGLFIYVSQAYTITDAIIAVFPWYQRYFQGGFQNAERLMEQKRKEKEDETFQEVLETIKKYRR